MNDINSQMQNIKQMIEGDISKINQDVLDLIEVVDSDDSQSMKVQLNTIHKNLAKLNEKIDSLSPKPDMNTIKNELDDWIASYLPKVIDQMVENKVLSILNANKQNI